MKKYISIDRDRIAENRNHEGHEAPVICVEFEGDLISKFYNEVIIQGPSTVKYVPDHKEEDPNSKAWIEVEDGVTILCFSKQVVEWT